MVERTKQFLKSFFFRSVIVFVFLMCFKNIFYMKKILNNFFKFFL